PRTSLCGPPRAIPRQKQLWRLSKRRVHSKRMLARTQSLPLSIGALRGRLCLRLFAVALFALWRCVAFGASAQSVPDRVVVLTFDDAVKSHRTFVAPLLKELGFGATFFVTHKWMDDRTNFMTWEDISEIHQMGFEIGNHS